ncbi:nucleoside triphosphate pyrophosphohydrolase [Caldovatus aquaticus]|uniref:Nucleoside triphosphate pyrophosphohydrolase n=1 Tax=Caldovatus aquaticus TaxID=2865671 RepID=A0ABS7EYN5_9PROT|nr:nucleoside triphosphate pyrophosphohydrolase [Caldovatus aquaticus]MBW8268470.1 nucleoside triphosphate pyrophosphohydrolase [Caldovatus aquaticus]
MPLPDSAAATALARLLSVMARLRDPVAGCPWDRMQNFRSIAPYTIEEAYEVSAVIQEGNDGAPDWAALQDELGDLLFQVVYHARMAWESGQFGFAEVADHIARKMILRHPHVFAGDEVRTAEEQNLAWEAQKAAERAARAETGTLAGVPAALPALTRAAKLTRRAARVGFDWPDADAILDKLAEEAEELRAELRPGAASPPDRARLADEVGDLLFVLANLARKLELDPEDCLRAANAKFERRFAAVERALAREGKTPAEVGLEAMEAHWQAAKAAERAPSA